MSNETTRTEPPRTLAEAVVALQAHLPEIKKSETAEVQTQKGTYSYTYANLAGISAKILPQLAGLGLAFIAKPTIVDEKFVLAYSLLHASGQREDGSYPLPATGTPQAIGSAITYGRRYCLCAVTGLAPEDDDDDAAEAQATAAKRGTAQRATRPRQSPPPTPGGSQAQRKSAASEPPPLPSDGSGMTPRQRAKIMALFGDLEVSRDDRLARISQIVGRTVNSANELSEPEAGQVIDALMSAKTAGDPDGNPGFTQEAIS